MKLADSFKKAGANNDALAVLKDAHQRFPKEAKILSAYGRLALAMGRDEQAGALLDKALTADPADWRALSAKAILDSRMGRFEAAHLALVRAQSLSGGDPAITNNLGVSYLVTGDAAKAAALFRQALRSSTLYPSYVTKLKRNLAIALAVKGDFKEADRLAGEAMPRSLKNAGGRDIAAYMKLQHDPI